MDIADLSENDSTVDVSDTRDRHDHGIEGINDILHLGVHILDLSVQQFDLFNRLNDLDGQGMVADAD